MCNKNSYTRNFAIHFVGNSHVNTRYGFVIILFSCISRRIAGSRPRYRISFLEKGCWLAPRITPDTQRRRVRNDIAHGWNRDFIRQHKFFQKKNIFTLVKNELDLYRNSNSILYKISRKFSLFKYFSSAFILKPIKNLITTQRTKILIAMIFLNKKKLLFQFNYIVS